MRCPCIECEKQGCGAFHDKCELYKQYAEERVLDRKDIKKKFEFTRNKKKPRKGSRTFEKQKNIGY